MPDHTEPKNESRSQDFRADRKETISRQTGHNQLQEVQKLYKGLCNLYSYNAWEILTSGSRDDTGSYQDSLNA